MGLTTQGIPNGKTSVMNIDTLKAPTLSLLRNADLRTCVSCVIYLEKRHELHGVQHPREVDHSMDAEMKITK